jgi:hypothetical protein
MASTKAFRTHVRAQKTIILLLYVHGQGTFRPSRSEDDQALAFHDSTEVEGMRWTWLALVDFGPFFLGPEFPENRENNRDRACLRQPLPSIGTDRLVSNAALTATGSLASEPPRSVASLPMTQTRKARASRERCCDESGFAWHFEVSRLSHFVSICLIATHRVPRADSFRLAAFGRCWRSVPVVRTSQCNDSEREVATAPIHL